MKWLVLLLIVLGGVWWLRHKVREGDVRATVMAVMTPERL